MNTQAPDEVPRFGNAAQPADAVDGATMQSDDRKSRSRIDEYRGRSLNAADPLEALLGNLSADLMVMSQSAAAHAYAVSESARSNIEEFDVVRSAMDLQLRAARQIVQLVRLKREIGGRNAP